VIKEITLSLYFILKKYCPTILHCGLRLKSGLKTRLVSRFRVGLIFETDTGIGQKGAFFKNLDMALTRRRRSLPVFEMMTNYSSSLAARKHQNRVIASKAGTIKR